MILLALLLLFAQIEHPVIPDAPYHLLAHSQALPQGVFKEGHIAFAFERGLDMTEKITNPSAGSVAQYLSPEKLHQAGQIPWGPVRSLLQDESFFGNIKSIVATAGLDITTVAHLDQTGMGGASKGQLCYNGGEISENDLMRFFPAWVGLL